MNYTIHNFGTFSSQQDSLQQAFAALSIEEQEQNDFDVVGTTHYPHLNGVWRILPIGPNKIASASYDCFARILNVETQQEGQNRPPLMLRAHKREVLCLAHDGTNLLTGSSDGQIYSWNCVSGKYSNVLREPKNNTTGFYSMALLENGQIATGACQKPNKCPTEKQWNHRIKIWDIETKQVVAHLDGHNGGIPDLAVFGERLVSASADKTLRIWNLTEKKIASIIENAHTDYIYSIAPVDNHCVASGARDRHIKIWDLETQQTTEIFSMDNSNSAHASTVYNVASFQNTLVLSASRDGYVRIWDRRNAECVKTLDAEGKFVYSVAGLPDDKIAAGTGTPKQKDTKASGDVIVWEFRR